ncbi:GntR family transcriptional regulator [Candidatus Izemoplasma sp. B36]|uniref:GntR family transcriptional regulator n=1 Tax=Candidatus Izemoplasma sp. B36 TaxID=3242468 RepID=UPI003556372C
MDEMYFKVPKYYTLKKEIVKKIDNDELLDDQMIPSERELIKEFGVSRITVRRAVDELVKEGYLYKIQGKGTYVKGDSKKQDLFSITSCTQDIINLGMTPSRKVFRCEVINSYPKRSRQMELDKADKLVVIDRVYYADEEPINRTITYLPEKYFPGLEEHDFHKESLYEVLENHYNLKITRATRTIEAIVAEDEISNMLEVENGLPLLLFRGTTYGIINNKEVPVETFKTCYRTDKYKFYINQVKV